MYIYARHIYIYNMLYFMRNSCITSLYVPSCIIRHNSLADLLSSPVYRDIHEYTGPYAAAHACTYRLY